jgi:ubiquinone/menaquinone biosynthesis C-methylase UbiE
MDRAEFDRFADEYRTLHAANIGASGEAPEYFANYKMKDFADEVERAGIVASNRWFLDFGVGTGNSIPFFVQHMPDARLCGVDVSLKSLEVARERHGSAARLLAFNGRTLPFADGTFNGAFACCVFHHIPLELHVRLLAEMRRVLAPGGVLMIYEHNPWNPLTVRAVTSCPFDENAILISAPEMRASLRRAGFRRVKVSFRVFFPAGLKALRPLESALKRIPLGAQYFAMAIR